MQKKNHKDGERLPRDLNQVKAQIGRERSIHIKETFKLRCIPSVANHASHHHFLAVIRRYGRRSNARDNKKLSSRKEPPVHHFNEKDEIPYEQVTFPIPDEHVTELPFVQQLPRSTTWVFTDSNQLMAESDSVLGKKQIHYEDGEAVELSSDNINEYEEETEKEKLEFSKDVDRFIWKIGQKHNLDDDLVVQSALSKFLKLDVSYILERYNELNKLKNGDTGEVKSMCTYFPESADRRFCRRCLIFDCHMHEEHQSVTNTRGNQSDLSDLLESEDVGKQCSKHCYLELRSVTEADDHVVDNDDAMSNNRGKNVVSGTNTETGDCVLTDPNELIKDTTEMIQAYNEWTPVEKDLYLQGVEIFGRNSCFISRNLLAGHKTCLEVYNYMREQDRCNMLLEPNDTAETYNQVNKVMSRKKSRFVRKKARLQKYACYPAALKNTAKETNKSYKQYTPCTCEPICGDQCPCLTNGNCCEKYCGCLKTCKNRFGGCNCVKGQCINRQCPCFAASRECDPDLCRSCWLGCGDGSLGARSQPIQCQNMRFLLKKHKKILLARSDVHGWGAFTRHSLKKKEFLGEYTGELVSHDEANERGRADDKIGFSYLFTLNDNLVIDARRKGNKFRFLNHSSTPNCYAKLMIVRGDHRIGLFARKAIEEGEELFFDYCYGPGHVDWSSGSKPKKGDGSKLKDIISQSKPGSEEKQLI